MAEKSISQMAAKWSQNLQSATTSMRDGANAVTENPAQKAIDAKQKMVQNWNASVTDGSWEAGLGRVSLADWRKAYIEKGIPRIAQGAISGENKMAEYLTEAIPYIRQGQEAVRAMPNLTLQHSAARMVAMMNHMAAFKRRK